MLLQLFRRLVATAKPPSKPLLSQTSGKERAVKLMADGDWHGAIAAFREHLEQDPFNLDVLNDLGACFSFIGDDDKARATFELAFSLDDTYIPVIVNHSKLLNDKRRSDEAMPFLRRAKICEPLFSNTDCVYASVCLTKGDVVAARRFQLQAWLGSFDNLRLANCYLFFSAYGELSEERLAAEHRFWAETLVPVADSPAGSPSPDLALVTPPLGNGPGTDRRVRIGYWSPDIRNHSVRYFFRPLLEHHDREHFEVFLYHDFPRSDEQTQQMQAAAEHFHGVCDLPDDKLCELIRSHRLDILVELAGHTSHNRLSLLQRRLATVQVTALGYPPTTGLPTIDAKLMDRHMLTPESSRYYSESPLVLPTSFWCFDPKQDVPITAEPPVIANRFVTFGCVGNIAKINPPTLASWAKILAAVPDSRLLIRSISFEDPVALEPMKQMLTLAGIDVGRVDLRRPEGGLAFFESYGQIDIILDTFPFNGGTTTCFAAYMGVPVVTLAGESLISRMGLSIMTNLDAQHLVARSFSDYERYAIALAGDLAFLTSFRREARAKFQQTSLGNGALFAREFEAGCMEILARQESGAPASIPSEIPYLPADEIMRRAYAVMRAGQVDAAQRILNHCLTGYPNAGSAHLLKAYQWTTSGQFEIAANYLLERKDSLSRQEQVAALISVARQYLLMDRKDLVGPILEQLAAMQATDLFDQLQIRLFQAACVSRPQAVEGSSKVVADSEMRRMHFLIPCNSAAHFALMCEQIGAVCGPSTTWELSYQRCDESDKLTAYSDALSQVDGSILVIAQKNVEIHDAGFAGQVAEALARSDIVGFAGATRWSRLDWRVDDFACKAGSFLTRSSERSDFVEAHWIGESSAATVENMSVLDGALLAVNRDGTLCDVGFDEDLLDSETLLEEAWTYAASCAGKRLLAHRNLGVFVDAQTQLDCSNRTEARMHWTARMEFDPFASVVDSYMSLSVPVPDVTVAVQVCHSFATMP